MDCVAVQPLLSPFLDGELDGSDREAVAVHVDRCSDCQNRLNELRSLGDLWSSGAPPEPSEQAWKRIAQNLANLDDGSSRRIRRRRWVAASILLLMLVGGAFAIVELGRRGFWSHVTDALAPINLVDYFDNEHMQAAGKSVNVDDVCAMVTFPTLKAPDLPNGYKLQKCSYFCDGVVRYQYARGNSEVILLLYRCGHPVVHGNKPLLDFYLHGKPLKVAQCKRRVSGSWQVNDTAVSLIASNDFDEFNELLKYVDCQLSGR